MRALPNARASRPPSRWCRSPGAGPSRAGRLPPEIVQFLSPAGRFPAWRYTGRNNGRAKAFFTSISVIRCATLDGPEPTTSELDHGVNDFDVAERPETRARVGFFAAWNTRSARGFRAAAWNRPSPWDLCPTPARLPSPPFGIPRHNVVASCTGQEELASLDGSREPREATGGRSRHAGSPQSRTSTATVCADRHCGSARRGV